MQWKNILDILIKWKTNMEVIKCGDYPVKWTSNEDPFNVSAELIKEDAGVYDIKICYHNEQLTAPSKVTVMIPIPLVDIHAMWTPNIGYGSSATNDIRSNLLCHG